MAKCVRKGCNRPVSPIPEAKEKRLCKKHYVRFCELKESKEKHLVYQINKRIPRILKRQKRGRIYYSVSSVKGVYIKKKSDLECLGMTKKAREKIIKIMKTPAWRNTESRIRRIRTTDEMPISLSEIMELYRLYSWIDFCKNSLNYAVHHLNGGCGNLKLQLFSLPEQENELESLLQSVIIIPSELRNKVINQKLRRKNIKNKIKPHAYPSLYKTMVKKYNAFNTSLEMVKIPISYPFHPSACYTCTKNDPENKNPPLFELLKNELRRLKVVDSDYIMENLEKVYSDSPFMLEMIAIHLFIRICCYGIQEFYESVDGVVEFDGDVNKTAISVMMEHEFIMKGYDYFIHIYNSTFTHKMISIVRKEKKLKWYNGKTEKQNLNI